VEDEMPIYEYKCEKCDHQFEVMQRITDDPLTECTKEEGKKKAVCKGKLKKLISQTSFSLKGGGWYKDGYSG
tara:strand:+ start:2300 stop:2515 length:216 start_codon:yes stop_codon:yes gene_type:complete